MTIDEARKIVADAADAEGRNGFAGLVRAGQMDDNVMVQHALSGATVEPTPAPPMVEMTPDRVDMGTVPNIADQAAS